jgi:outer membrane protein assembly factor BamB
MKSGFSLWSVALPVALAITMAVLLGVWLWPRSDDSLQLRAPGSDNVPDSSARLTAGNPVLRGTLTRGSGQVTLLEGAWPQFRGPQRDGTSLAEVKLTRTWAPGQPQVLWSTRLGEGYAGPAVLDGRVYVMDYDREGQRDALRCLSLQDGNELWRFSYPVTIKRNHGMSRTVPTLASNRVVAIGPKCHVLCLDQVTGELQWGLDMERQFGATVPPWYTGQCPLIDGDNVILAPGGPDALLVAVSLNSGEVVWKAPNPHGWKMTHSSVVAGEFAGRRMYVYCASGGVVGVSATDGSILWDTTDWRISIANVPSPVLLGDGRIFLSGGYNAGSMMLRLHDENGSVVVRTAFRLKPEQFGSTQQTPIHHQHHLYGVRPDGQFTCLDLEGNVLWSSGPEQTFGLGPYLLADGALLAMDDAGTLSLIEAAHAGFRLLGQTKVLRGRESWGPMALADGRLLARDLEEMVCLDVGR